MLSLLDAYSTKDNLWRCHIVTLKGIVQEGGQPMGRVIDPLRRERPDAVVRVCVQCGTLDALSTAAQLAREFLSAKASSADGGGVAAGGFARTGTIPVSLLDTLVASCVATLARVNRGGVRVVDEHAADTQAAQLFRVRAAELFQLWEPKKKEGETKRQADGSTTAAMPPPPLPVAVGGGGFGNPRALF